MTTRIVGALVGGLLTFVALQHLHGQERQHELKTWQMVQLPDSNGSTWGTVTYFDPVRVDVIDTEGVCLYVVRGGHDRLNVVTVLKTQLKPGVGCQ